MGQVDELELFQKRARSNSNELMTKPLKKQTSKDGPIALKRSNSSGMENNQNQELEEIADNASPSRDFKSKPTGGPPSMPPNKKDPSASSSEKLLPFMHLQATSSPFMNLAANQEEDYEEEQAKDDEAPLEIQLGKRPLNNMQSEAGDSASQRSGMSVDSSDSYKRQKFH